MCGRYSLALRPAQIRAHLQNDNMPAFEAPDDDADDAPRQTYNFAPGYNGIIYRADVPYWGTGSLNQSHKKGQGVSEGTDEGQPAAEEEQTETETKPKETRYKLQSMRWGLIPFWERNPNFGSMLKTINCRDDSLIENRGMWNTMKQKKRCIVIAQGFYEWLKKGKEKVPHYVKRKDGKLMCMAGLWDCVQYEGSEEKLYTYTIITTSSNKQLNFLHDRMPVILNNGSEELRTWLDPKRSTWSKELQTLLRPYEGELEVYPVSKEVGKVGNNSPQFIIPVGSSENKSNIANFFAKGAAKKNESQVTGPAKISSTSEAKTEGFEEESKTKKESTHEPGEDRKAVDHKGTGDNAPLSMPEGEVKKGVKRELEDVLGEQQPLRKATKTSGSPIKPDSPSRPARKMRNATSNNTASPSKSASKDKGNQRITNFFRT